jgi:hypothetical protein
VFKKHSERNDLNWHPAVVENIKWEDLETVGQRSSTLLNSDNDSSFLIGKVEKQAKKKNPRVILYDGDGPGDRSCHNRRFHFPRVRPQ